MKNLLRMLVLSCIVSYLRCPVVHAVTHHHTTTGASETAEKQLNARKAEHESHAAHHTGLAKEHEEKAMTAKHSRDLERLLNNHGAEAEHEKMHQHHLGEAKTHMEKAAHYTEKAGNTQHRLDTIEQKKESRAEKVEHYKQMDKDIADSERNARNTKFSVRKEQAKGL